MIWHQGGGAGREYEQVGIGADVCVLRGGLPRAGVQEGSLLGTARVGLPCTLVRAGP